MKTKVFTVYDSKAEAYLPPFFVATKGQAVRSFTDAANDSGHNFCRHAADYTLFEIGEYDDATGVITMHEAKINLGVAVEFVSSNNQNSGWSRNSKAGMELIPPPQEQ